MMPQDATTIASFCSLIGTLQSFVLAFIVVTVWQNLQSASKITYTEATALTSLYRDTEWLDSNQQEQAKHAIKNYTSSVIDFDFPQMKNAQLAKESGVALNELFKIYANFEKTAPLNIQTLATITQLNLISQNREYRLNASQSSLPGGLYFILIIAGLFVIVLSALIPLSSWPKLALCNIMLTIASVLLLALAFVMDHPFSGDVSVSSQAYQDALRSFEKVK